MSIHAGLPGLHQSGEGRLFRLEVGWKYLLILTLSLPVLTIQAWSVTFAASALMITLLVSSGINPTQMLRIGRAIWLILGLLAAYQLVVLNPRTVVVVSGNLLPVVLATRLLTLTTSTLEPSNALIVVLRPIRFAGFNPERVALTAALMIRFIPCLLDLFDDARDAARAHRAEHNMVALLMPMVLGPVAHAERTGEVLTARGLGEHEQR